MLKDRSHAVRRAPAWLLLLLAATFLWSPARAAAPRLRTLIVGGGPEARHNQVAIERNVYYVSHLLSAGSPRWVLFTNGDASARTVLYEEARPAQATGERLFALLFGRDDETSPTMERYRAPQFGK